MIRIVWPSVGDFGFAKPGLCEFHPPVSKGFVSFGVAEGSHLGHLAMDGSCVSSLHELVQEDLALIHRELVQNALYVLWAQSREHLLGKIEARLLH